MLCPIDYMKKVGITELRSKLSRYLDQVKRGNSILVLDRNQPVAQIVPLQKARSIASDEARMARLERKGLIRRGSGDSGQWLVKRRPVKVPGSKIYWTSDGAADEALISYVRDQMREKPRNASRPST